MDEDRPNQPGEQQPPASEPTIRAVSAPDEPAPQRSGMAVASLILAFLFAPLGMILGIVALVQISREPNRLRGYGLALAGTILGAFFTLMLFFLAIPAAILFPVFSRARETAKKSACMNNVRQISRAMMMYAYDNDGRFPKSENWNDLLKPYMKDADILICPAVRPKETVPTYGMNARLSGIAEVDVQVPPDVVMFFDSVPGENQAGGPELLPQPPRHGDVNIVGFADGHVLAVAEFEPAELNWDPSVVRLPPTPSDEDSPRGG